ncbi:Uncharacterized protein dnm_011170 [Desulfonema magnum]|uniref:Uncharacterized protein n=1 Tax=Desulfonema magnum TaxID=45655 RepID=A0A975BGZ2_9BACT|nr:Uncharacterized protein dnm_011170 [Desulfonema magnum]
MILKKISDINILTQVSRKQFFCQTVSLSRLKISINPECKN